MRDHTLQVGLPEDLPLFLTVREIAALLRIGKSLAYDMVKRGEIGSVRMGRVVRVPRDCFVQWLKESQQQELGG